MAINQLNIDFTNTYPKTKILGRRDLLSRELAGSWATSFKGRGLEFTGYRRYTFTDDASNIDWRASLRAKDLLVREFEEFKNFNVVFVLDVSNSMLCTSGDKLKAEYGAELAYALSKSASNAGESVGLAMISDKLVGSIQPSFGKGISKRFEMLLTNKELYGGVKDFKKSLLQLNSVIGPRCVLIIISDFLGLPEGWESYISLLAIKHDVVGVMIKDKRDRELPRNGGQFTLKDPNSDETMIIDSDIYADEYKKLAIEHEAYIKSVFKKLRGRSILIENCTDFSHSLEKFFHNQRVRT